MYRTTRLFLIPRLIVPVVLLASTASGALAGEYHDYNALTAALEALTAENPNACRLFSIGSSRTGSAIRALELSRGQNAADRLAMAIIAGVDGDEPAGTEVALGVARSLLSAGEGEPGAILLADYTVYVIPRANPDAAEWFFLTPKTQQRNALRPWDDDRDGLFDEDGPEDLNADGMITLMRLRDPEATHLPDPVEPRLLKEADRAKGEKPIYKVYVEGTDNDGDEEYNEDGPGGVDLNLNFMHGYAEHAPGAGPHQISEPESKALTDFFLTHPRIALAVVYGRHDNVVKTPKGDKKDATKRAPVELHKEDVAIYKEIGKKYREITEIKKVPDEASGGALFAWTYAQYGIPSFACRVWVRPEPKKEEKKKGKKEKEGEEGEEDSQEEGKEQSPAEAEPKSDQQHSDTPDSGPAAAEPEPTPAGEAAEQSPDEKTPQPPVNPSPGEEDATAGKDKKKPDKADEKKKEKEEEAADKELAAWLKYSDKQRGGEGFVPWTPFDHPQLGPVEIGGIVPFFTTAPPADELDAIIERQLAFVLDLAKRFPKVSLAVPKVTRLADSIFEIETALVNDGYFPTGLSIAKQNRRVRPIVVTLDTPLERMVGGNRVEKIWSVPGSGGRSKLRWVVRGDPDSTVTIRTTSEKYGDMSLEVSLTPTPDEKGGS